MKEMKEKEILKKTFPIQYYSLTEEFKEMDKEDRDLYLFLRGGLTAK
ncbi:MAG: hypothetical protein KKA10_17545 [Euryarchaeota archaeon]|nr:hypothetical protein [Euryarchaeota archaeon]